MEQETTNTVDIAVLKTRVDAISKDISGIKTTVDDIADQLKTFNTTLKTGKYIFWGLLIGLGAVAHKSVGYLANLFTMN